MELFKNPLLYILLLNCIAFIWGIRVWRKGIRERWMDQLRESGSDILGHARKINLLDRSNEQKNAMSEFDRAEEKFLLLFEYESQTYTRLKNAIGNIREALNKNDGRLTPPYDEFKKLLHERKHKEWKSINRIFW